MKRIAILDERKLTRKRVLDIVEYDDGCHEIEIKHRGEYITLELDSFLMLLDHAMDQFSVKVEMPDSLSRQFSSKV